MKNTARRAYLWRLCRFCGLERSACEMVRFLTYTSVISVRTIQTRPLRRVPPLGVWRFSYKNNEFMQYALYGAVRIGIGTEGK